MSIATLIRSAAAATVLASGATLAQQAQPTTWETMPRMQLEQQFAGPLQDTVIQRWRDPAAGAICYVYLPIVAAHSAPTATGYVQYGPNSIGTIYCVKAVEAIGSGPSPGTAAAPNVPAPTQLPVFR